MADFAIFEVSYLACHVSSVEVHVVVMSVSVQRPSPLSMKHLLKLAPDSFEIQLDISRNNKCTSAMRSRNTKSQLFILKHDFPDAAVILLITFSLKIHQITRTTLLKDHVVVMDVTVGGPCPSTVKHLLVILF